MSAKWLNVNTKPVFSSFSPHFKPHNRNYIKRTAKGANSSERFVVHDRLDRLTDVTQAASKNDQLTSETVWTWTSEPPDNLFWNRSRFQHSVITGAECGGGYLFVFYRCNDWVWLKRHAVHVVECRHITDVVMEDLGSCCLLLVKLRNDILKRTFISNKVNTRKYIFFNQCLKKTLIKLIKRTCRHVKLYKAVQQRQNICTRLCIKMPF